MDERADDLRGSYLIECLGHVVVTLMPNRAREFVELIDVILCEPEPRTDNQGQPRMSETLERDDIPLGIQRLSSV